MRKFKISYPDDDGNPVEELLTEDVVREQYWNYWESKMIEKYGNIEKYTFNDCLEDWIAIHWAEEIEDD